MPAHTPVFPVTHGLKVLTHWQMPSHNFVAEGNGPLTTGSEHMAMVRC